MFSCEDMFLHTSRYSDVLGEKDVVAGLTEEVLVLIPAQYLLGMVLS